MEEIWKDIYFIENGLIWDYRGLYQVSNLGNVKSLNYRQTSKEKILHPRKTNDGYLRVCLYKDEKTKECCVHRLVAFMFIKNDDPKFKTQVNHINEFEKDNNCVENLEWVTPKYNTNYGTRNERSGKTLSRKIIGFSLTDKKVIVLQSAQQSKKFGFNQSAICRCCNGERKSHKGFKWYYI